MDLNGKYVIPTFNDVDISESKAIETLMVTSHFLSFSYEQAKEEGFDGDTMMGFMLSPLLILFGPEFIEAVFLFTEHRLGYELPKEIKDSVLDACADTPTVEAPSISDEILKGFYEDKT